MNEYPEYLEEVIKFDPHRDYLDKDKIKKALVKIQRFNTNFVGNDDLKKKINDKNSELVILKKITPRAAIPTVLCLDKLAPIINMLSSITKFVKIIVLKYLNKNTDTSNEKGIILDMLAFIMNDSYTYESFNHDNFENIVDYIFGGVEVYEKLDIFSICDIILDYLTISDINNKYNTIYIYDNKIVYLRYLCKVNLNDNTYKLSCIIGQKSDILNYTNTNNKYMFVLKDNSTLVLHLDNNAHISLNQGRNNIGNNKYKNQLYYQNDINVYYYQNDDNYLYMFYIIDGSSIVGKYIYVSKNSIEVEEKFTCYYPVHEINMDGNSIFNYNYNHISDKFQLDAFISGYIPLIMLYTKS